MLAASASTIAPAAGCRRRHVREQPAHQRPQRAADERYQACGLGDAHHAKPQRHDPDETDRDLHRGRRRSTAPLVTASAVPLIAATTSATAIRPNQM